jgi:hypothetical protein
MYGIGTFFSIFKLSAHYPIIYIFLVFISNLCRNAQRFIFENTKLLIISCLSLEKPNRFITRIKVLSKYLMFFPLFLLYLLHIYI